MALCDAKIGLGAILAPESNQLIDLYVMIEKTLLEQRKQQMDVGAQAANASGQFAYSNQVELSEGTRNEANGMIANGTVTLGAQAGASAYGESCEGGIQTAQSKVTNAGEAVDILENNGPMENGVGRVGAGPNSPFHEYESSFKYGEEPLSPEDRAGLSDAPDAVAHRNALDRAKEAKKGFSDNVQALTQKKTEFMGRINNVGQGMSMAANGMFRQLQATDQFEQASVQAAKVASDFVTSTAQALASSFDSLYGTANGHITTMLQTEDALFQADSARG